MYGFCLSDLLEWEL